MNDMINTNDLLNYIKNSQTDKAVSLNEAYDIFMNYKSIHNRKGTSDVYKALLKPVWNWLALHHIEFTNQVDNKVVDEYVRNRLPQVKAITVNKEMMALTAVFHLLLKKDLISGIKFSFEKLKTTKTQVASIKTEDVKRCLNYLKKSKVSDKFRLVFMLILTTGVRTTELVNIRNTNIDLNNKRILLDFTKNGKQRYLYIVDQIIPLLQKTMSKRTFLFNDEEGVQMTTNSVRKFFQHVKANLKLETLSPHKLRHYYATNLYKNSLDIYLVSKLLGHSDTKTTEIYLDINEHDNQLKNQYYNPLNDFDPLSH